MIAKLGTVELTVNSARIHVTLTDVALIRQPHAWMTIRVTNTCAFVIPHILMVSSSEKKTKTCFFIKYGSFQFFK